MSWLKRILGQGASLGITHQELQKSAKRDRLEESLPWLMFKAEDHSFLNADNTIGFIWECIPLFFCGDSQEKALAALLKQNFPKGTVMQWILYSDPNIDFFIDAFLANKSRPDPLVKKSAVEYANFIKQASQGCKSLNGIPVRNFRLILSLKCESKISLDILSVIEQTLSSAGFCPRRWQENDLLAWCQQVFNGYQTAPTSVDHTRPLREQVIQADTEILIQKDSVQIGDRYARCLTPKRLGKTINKEQSNRLFGGIMGPLDDSKQLKTPFLYSLNILFDDLSFDIHKKASMTMAMRAAGSFAIALQRRIDEYCWTLDALADQETFVKVIPSLWLFGESEEQVRDSSSRTIDLWKTEADIELQSETLLRAPLLVASLPLGLYDLSGNINLLQRHFIIPSSTVAVLIPSQADFRGSINPVLAFVGRKGQVVGLDLFDSRANAHNFLVSAETGAGKSFSLNFLCSNYYAAGAKVRIVDIGYSYKKLAQTTQGRFLDFGAEKICINPFDFIAHDEEDIDRALNAAINVVAEMTYSASGALMKEEERTLVKQAAHWTLQQGRQQEGITAVYEYLKSYPKLAELEDNLPPDILETAHRMAFNLKDFTHTGRYGKFFNGPSNFNIASDDLVVIELEQLRNKTELFKVVVMQILNSVTQDLYLSDRSTKRFILFEEAASLLQKNGTHDLSRLGNMIDEGYRRARKYQGSFGVVLQSLLDLKTFGPVGDVIKANATFKFLLEGKTYREAADKGIINHQGLTLELIESVKNNKPLYSELFLDTPFGVGVTRLAVDPWTYWVNTSQGAEVSRFESLIKQGLTPLQAIERLSTVSC